MKALSPAGLRDFHLASESLSPTRSVVYKSRCSQRLFCQSRHRFPYTSIYGFLSLSGLIRFSSLSIAATSSAFYASEETGERDRPATQRATGATALAGASPSKPPGGDSSCPEPANSPTPQAARRRRHPPAQCREAARAATFRSEHDGDQTSRQAGSPRRIGELDGTARHGRSPRTADRRSDRRERSRGGRDRVARNGPTKRSGGPHVLDQPAAGACPRPGSLSAPPERSDGGNLQAVKRVLSRLSMTNRTPYSMALRGGVRRV